MLGRANTAHLITAYDESMPESVRAPALERVALGRLWACLYAVPDGVAANKLVIHYDGMRTTRLLIWEGACFAHCLSLSVNHGLDAMSLVDREYSLVSILTGAGNAVEILDAHLHLDRQLKVYPGIAPPDAEAEFASFVL